MSTDLGKTGRNEPESEKEDIRDEKTNKQRDYRTSAQEHT